MMLSEAASTLNSSIHGQDVLFRGCGIDSRQAMDGELFIAIQGERFDAHEFVEQAKDQGAAALLVNRVVECELPQLLVDDSKAALGQLASAWRQRFRTPMIAVTGSNGKTTVKEMLGHILQQQAAVLLTQGNFNNDIGMPLTLLGLAEQHQYIVLEMGANHAGEIQYLSHLARPDVAVITQCAPAHLEGFGSLQGVAEAKAEIYQGLADNGVAVINADDDFADYWRQQTAAQKQLLFAIENPADVRATEIHLAANNQGYQFELHYQQQSAAVSLQVAGRHNVMNALAAASCALALDIDLQTIVTGLAAFQPVKGRMQLKQAVNGARLIDDSYNANPASLAAAVEHLVQQGDDTCLVLGDMAELGADAEAIHRQAGENARQQGVIRLLAIGPLSQHAATGFGDGAQHFKDKSTLVDELLSSTGAASTILVKGSRSMQMEDIVNRLVSEVSQSC